jgi:hypothetical protein
VRDTLFWFLGIKFENSLNAITTLRVRPLCRFCDFNNYLSLFRVVPRQAVVVDEEEVTMILLLVLGTGEGLLLA